MATGYGTVFRLRGFSMSRRGASPDATTPGGPGLDGGGPGRARRRTAPHAAGLNRRRGSTVHPTFNQTSRLIPDIPWLSALPDPAGSDAAGQGSLPAGQALPSQRGSEVHDRAGRAAMNRLTVGRKHRGSAGPVAVVPPLASLWQAAHPARTTRLMEATQRPGC